MIGFLIGLRYKYFKKKFIHLPNKLEKNDNKNSVNLSKNSSDGGMNARMQIIFK
jgi:hypothetical protein